MRNPYDNNFTKSTIFYEKFQNLKYIFQKNL